MQNSDFAALSVSAALGSAGAAAKYLRDYTTSGNFRLRVFLASAAVGGFVGATVGSSLPAVFDYRDTLLLMSGFSAPLFLQIAEAKAAALFRAVGDSPPPPKQGSTDVPKRL